jgi:hypothetical protein
MDSSSRRSDGPPRQQRDFAETLDGLRDDLRPQGILEESCVTTMAQSYVRMAAMLRYENIAALKYHQRRERELNERIAAANAPEAARLQAERDDLRRAGLWRPTIPGPREALAIIRYSGSLDRAIRHASSELKALKNVRLGEGPRPPLSASTKVQKQTHYSVLPSGGHEPGEGPRMPLSADAKMPKQTHHSASPSGVLRLGEGPQGATFSASQRARTKPLTSMFTGNRHARRRAKALATRRR